MTAAAVAVLAAVVVAALAAMTSEAALWEAADTMADAHHILARRPADPGRRPIFFHMQRRHP